MLKLTIFFLIATTAITQNTIELKDTSESLNQKSFCGDGYFLAFMNPEYKGDTNTYCAKCECGYNSICQDYVGCSVCSPQMFKMYRYPKYKSRSYVYCQNCDWNCYTFSCRDYTGCDSCKDGYTRQETQLSSDRSYYYCSDRSQFEGSIAFLVAFLVTVIVCCCICSCCEKCKVNRLRLKQQQLLTQ
jgi:hypothetical protein